MIRLATTQGLLEIRGQKLTMTRLAATQVEICGEIVGIGFVEGVK